MINIKKERKKIIKDLEYGERIGVLKHEEGQRLLDKFDNDCHTNKYRFDRQQQKKIKVS